MFLESVMLKPGVLFASTRSGGVLMDLEADKFIALTPTSSAIWGSLAEGNSTHDVIETIMQIKAVPTEQAKRLLGYQLDCWEKARLVKTAGNAATTLPLRKATPPTVPRELDMNRVLQARLDFVLAAQLFVAEAQYRRALLKHGLADTLVFLQGEKGTPPTEPKEVIHRLVRNYYALRRTFRQGREARDCLFRSLALAAVLRRKGIPADLCIGIVDLPFASHAWVEALDLILNEESSKRIEYTIIGRF